MPDSAPRLLLVAFAPFPAPTGASTRLAQRVAAFADAGYLLDVLTPKTAELPHVSKLLGARILRVPMPTPSAEPRPARRGRAPRTASALPVEHLGACYLAFERAVRRQLELSDYDAVHLVDPFAGWTCLQLARGAQVVFEMGESLPLADLDPALAGELRQRERDCVRESAAVLAPTEELARRAYGLGALKSRVHLMRPAADLELFCPPTDRRRRAGGPVRIALSAARLSGEELDLLAEALQLVPGLLEVRLEVSAALPDGVPARLRRDPLLSERFQSRAPQLYEDLGPFYQEADVGLVVATGPRRGQLPPVRLQAMAELMSSGLAPILPDLPAVREIVEPGKQALLVPPADPEALADAITELITHPARRRSLGTAARQRAGERLDERLATARLLGIYGSLLSPSISISDAAYLAEPSLTGGSVISTHTLNELTIAAAPTWSRPALHPRPSLVHALQPDDGPTDPDSLIHGKAERADLSSAAATDPEAESPIRIER